MLSVILRTALSCAGIPECADSCCFLVKRTFYRLYSLLRPNRSRVYVPQPNR